MKVDLGQNVRLVVSLWRFVVSSFRYGVSSCRIVVSSFRHTDAPGRFVVSSRLLFRRFVVSLCRFVVSSSRFVVSTRALRETIIRLTLHEVLPISRGFGARPLYM